MDTRLRIAKSVLQQNGLNDWSLSVNSRAKSRHAQCNYTDKIIEFSRKTLTEEYPTRDFLNTVYHEVAHAIVGPGHGHDRVWREKHISLGGNGMTRSTINLNKNSDYKYVGICPRNSEHKRYKHRRSAKMFGISCGQCSPGKFDPELKFKWYQQK